MCSSPLSWVPLRNRTVSSTHDSWMDAVPLGGGCILHTGNSRDALSLRSLYSRSIPAPTVPLPPPPPSHHTGSYGCLRLGSKISVYQLSQRRIIFNDIQELVFPLGLREKKALFPEGVTTWTSPALNFTSLSSNPRHFSPEQFHLQISIR